MELWDLYDKDRIKTGRTVERGKPLSDGDYHIIVHICIFNTNNEMLIQQRQPFKVGWPDKWDLTVGGCATTGDTSQQAAERELFEEIGLSMDLSGRRPHLTINFSNGFDDYYLIEADVDINCLKLQYEEVQAVKWATKEEILNMMDDGSFIPYYKSLVSLLFDSRKCYGVVNWR